MRSEDEDNRIYKVVINHEEQYSIRLAGAENALGWKDVGKVGTRKECLAYIEAVWLDMRPLSLRRHMEPVEKKKREVLGAAFAAKSWITRSRSSE